MTLNGQIQKGQSRLIYAKRYISIDSDPLLSHFRVIPAKAGLNSTGLNLNSRRLVRRMKYMDVFHNPVTYGAYANQ